MLADVDPDDEYYPAQWKTGHTPTRAIARALAADRATWMRCGVIARQGLKIIEDVPSDRDWNGKRKEKAALGTLALQLTPPDRRTGEEAWCSPAGRDAARISKCSAYTASGRVAARR